MRRLAALSLAAALLVGACGSDDSSKSSGPAASDPAAVTEQDIAAAKESLAEVEVTIEGDADPTVKFDQPMALRATDFRVLTPGTGDEVATGDSVKARVAGFNARNGEQFARFSEPLPPLVMDEAEFFPGLVRAMVGQQVGARVLVGMAPFDAYQPAGGMPQLGIEADDSVLFVVDIVSATTPVPPLEQAQGTPVDPAPGLPTVDFSSGKPAITIPEGEPSAELINQLLIKGDGAVIEAGQTVVAHYTGVLWKDGSQFDSSWDRSEPLEFPVGVGRVIPAWDEGLVGQNVGTRLLLVAPPAKGYGEQGSPPKISGTDTLVFVVDILGVR